MTHPLADQLKHQPFPHLAGALRRRAVAIADTWMEVVRETMPQMGRLTAKQLRNEFPEILEAIALAMSSGDRRELQALLDQSPEHGMARFITAHNLVDMFEEERLLRGVIVVELEAQLDRRLHVDEAAALHATIDIMVQQSVLSMVNKQKKQLRALAESELKFIAFLSHDLSNNLFVLQTALEHIAREVASMPQYALSMDLMNTARQAIDRTTQGMRRLLEHERLRKQGETPTFKRLNLFNAARSIAKQFGEEAHGKGLRLEVKPPAEEATVQTDEDLLALVLQNLLGNAVRYADRGTVQVTIHRAQPGQDQPGAAPARWHVCVADQGPGIEPEHQQYIFDAFKRGESFSQEGVGLGLAIASQAARLLGGELSLDSQPGSGSRFTLSLPEDSPPSPPSRPHNQ